MKRYDPESLDFALQTAGRAGPAMTATLPATLVIDIAGHPAPKGSHKCVGGRGKVKHHLIEMSPLLPDWTARVVTAAKARMRLTGWTTITDPCRVDIVAWFPRPASVTRPYPSTRSVGDIDKIARGCHDPLVVAGVIADDSLIVDSWVRERYAIGAPGARITVRPMTEGSLF